jgi:hypothetical protein
MDDGNYTDAHRAFLQAFLSQPVMPVDSLKPLIEAISRAQGKQTLRIRGLDTTTQFFDEVLRAQNVYTEYCLDPNRPLLENDVTQPIINTMVQTVNARLGVLDFEIRSTKNQNDRTLTYALVNTTSDTFTQLATSFSPDEIAFVKRVLDAMFEVNITRTREVMAIKGMAATNLAKATRNRQNQAVDADDESAPAENIKSIKHDEAERVLLQLVTQGFFEKSRKGYYSLAPRALIELRTYLKETYNELPAEDDDEDDAPPIIRIKDCEACREIVTVGLRCSNRECPIRWHDGCANQYFRGGRAAKCPKCDTGWTGDVFVGERADRVRASTAGRSSGRTRVEEDEEEDE